MLKNSTYGESGGSHCFQGGVSGWPEGICKALVFQGKATPASKSASYEPKPEWLSPLVALPKASRPIQKKQRPRGAFMRLTGTLQNVVSKARRPLRRVRRPWRCTRRPFLPGKSLRLTPSQRQRGFSCPPRWIPSPPSAPPAHGCGAPSAPSAAPWCGFSHCPGRRCR